MSKYTAMYRLYSNSTLRKQYIIAFNYQVVTEIQTCNFIFVLMSNILSVKNWVAIKIVFTGRLPLWLTAAEQRLADWLTHCVTYLAETGDRGCSSFFVKIAEYLGLRPEIFSALLGPDRLWYESLSLLLSLLEEGADTEMVCPRGRWPPLGEMGPGCAGAAGNSNLILAPPFWDDTTAGPSTPWLWPPSPLLSPPVLPSTFSFSKWGCWGWGLPSEGALGRDVSPEAVSDSIAALEKASGKVWSSGEELDLFSPWPWDWVWVWKGSSGPWLPGVEDPRVGWSMGIAPSLTSSSVDFSSSWLEVEEDWHRQVDFKNTAEGRF